MSAFPDPSQSPYTNPDSGIEFVYSDGRWAPVAEAHCDVDLDPFVEWAKNHEALSIHAAGIIAPLENLPED